MIRSEKELRSAERALARAEKALLALKKKVYEESPETYHRMSGPYVDYVDKLQREIHDFVGLSSAKESAVPLWIRLRGPRIGEGVISISLLSRFLNDFKMGVQRIADYQSSQLIRETGRPKKKIQELCDFKVRIMPGSLKIGLSFPIPGRQMEIGGELKRNIAEEAVKSLMSGIVWSINPRPETEIEEVFPDPRERYLVLTQVGKISPQMDGDISNVEFRGKFVPRETAVLTSDSALRVKEEVKKSIPPEEVVSEGVMREIDLDARCFDLRNRPGEVSDITCEYHDELEEDAVDGLGKRVRIVGMLKKDRYGRPRRLIVDDIEVLGIERA